MTPSIAGFAAHEGDILAYLNCDEQYLPGCLQTVEAFFRAHPAVDVLFGDVVVVNADLEYLFHRKVQVPLRHHTWVSHLPTLTCATFFRRTILDKHGLFFDARLRDVGDAEWMLRLLEHRIPHGGAAPVHFGVHDDRREHERQAERDP